MIRLSAAVAFLVLATSAASAQDCLFAPANGQLALAYRACVLSKARQFEPSGESADNVAVAAVSACYPARDAYGTAIQLCATQGFVSQLLTTLDAGLHNKAIEAVVEIRARHHRSKN